MDQNLAQVRDAGLRYLAYKHRLDEKVIEMRARHEKEFIEYIEQFLPKELRDEETAD